MNHLAERGGLMSRSASDIETSIRELSRALKIAFANVSPPDAHNVMACQPECEEYWAELETEEWEIYNFIAGKHWSGLDVLTSYYSVPTSNLAGRDIYVAHSTTLYFLSLEAFHFYFPAFIIGCLKYLSNGDRAPSLYTYNPCGDTLFFLVPHKEESITHFESRLALFSTDQRRVIQEFLLLIKVDFPAIWSLYSGNWDLFQIYWFS